MGGRSSSFGKKQVGGVKLDLPELEGSEKQIAWAKDIRQEWVDAINRFEKGGDPEGRYGSDAQNLAHFSQYVLMGNDATSDVDFPEFDHGFEFSNGHSGNFKSWMKSSYDDFKHFPLSKNEAAVERPRVRDYYHGLMSTYNKYAPKGKVPNHDTAPRQILRDYARQEGEAYRKAVVKMAKKAINKETSASEYINHYRNWTWSAKK